MPSQKSGKAASKAAKPSRKSPAGKAARKGGAARDAMLESLKSLMRDSILPGDTPFAGRPLTEAARFVLETALKREPGRSALALTTMSDKRRILRTAIVNDDMPFLVDSIAATFAAQGLAIDRLVHPVVPVRRTAKGTLNHLGKKPGKTAKDMPGDTRDDSGQRESMIYIETQRIDAKQRRVLERELRITLGDVRAAVSDWPKLQAAMADDAARQANPENTALLEWFNGGMLTQLGHLTRLRDGSHANLLGICRKSAKALLADASYERAFAWFESADKAGSPRGLLVVKSNRVSRVHRHVPLDLYITPLREGDEIKALSVHAGVWTSAALAAPPTRVPHLRATLDELGKELGFDPSGHAGKALVHALTALPHDLVITFEPEDVKRITTTMMSLVDRPRPRLAMIEAPLSRHVFAFVWMPRDMLSTQVREEVQALLTETQGVSLLDWGLEVEGGNLAMIRFVLDIRNAAEPLDAEALESRLQDLLRGWGEAVERELAQIEDPARAAAISARYASAFPQFYRTTYGAAEAAIDIARLRALGHGEEILRDARLYRLDSDEPHCLRLKVYQQRGALPLSDAVPALENFGFRVMTEIPTSLDRGELGTVHDFTLATADGEDASSLLERAPTIEQAIAAVLTGQAENDPFNRLIAGTALEIEEANWLRAFYRYLRQAGTSFTIYTVVDALSGAPAVTRAMIDLFRARHEPGIDADRDAAAQSAAEAIRRGLAKVQAINDDRLLRLYNALIEAILRTNCFAAAGSEALAFKIDSSLVPGLPKPLPWREIFVYSARVEGIHLRAGPVARGGLRWSDRRDDFRTEVLGLMKAQRVKNAVIVPTGAKGGFYPKLLPSPAKDRAGWAGEGQASYQVFIRALLSVTDNLVGERVVHPEDVVIRDGDDPYFVVAADKGTARFSDIANAIAEQRDFWLGDAFASGGSNGYDHKAMAITARGAWVSVQRHFLEMGIDVQTESIRVVGCGDMSGDVFGNGMLLSKAIKLVGAFDHRHIFIDPDPDPAKSWAERKRMFALSGSSWADYNEALISKGGGVYPRDAKRIKLSKAAQNALGVEEAEWEPEALISAVLRAPVDLIWFGGIGTYIKATAENNAAVGDTVNDALRIDAASVRAKVIGEGANLGITQAGRIEFALEGGRINTDFIDNSAGVDCSDNEVNIKIALAAARRAGRLSEAKRNTLLEDMTDEVAAIVLEDNRLQALALSIAEAGGAGTTGSNLRLLQTLESDGRLDRRTEGLADDQVFKRRAADGQGLTRPELAVLLSSAKLVLQDAIEASTVPDDPALEPLLFEAFPEPLRKKFDAQIRQHRLRREIIATKLANRIVNRIGVVHPFELAEEEGVGLAAIAASFVVVEELYGVGEIWDQLDTASMPETARLALFERLAGAFGNLMSDVLRSHAGKVEAGAVIANLETAVARLSAAGDDLLSAETSQQSMRLRDSLVASGAPGAMAERIAKLFAIDGSVGLSRLSREVEVDPIALTRAFTDIGARAGLDWAQSTAALMSPSDIWERLLVDGLARDFQQMRLDFLKRLMRRKSGREDPCAAVSEWAEKNAASIRQFRAMIARARAHSTIAPAMLAQIASQARNLLER